MTLTGTLPNATVGTAYNGHLTLGGTFTAPVTIDASVGTIPAWMTVTVTGTDVAFTGTPATGDIATDTFTVRATDSSATPQVATSPQSVVVSAGGASFVQKSPTAASTQTSGSRTATPTFGAGATAGNLIVVVAGAPRTDNGAVTGPSGFTLIASGGNFSGYPEWFAWGKTAAGGETAFTVNSAYAVGSSSLQATAYEIAGSTQTLANILASSENVNGGGSFAFNSITAAGSGVAIAVAALYSVQTTLPTGSMTGWTSDSQPIHGVPVADFLLYTASQSVASSGNVSGTATWSLSNLTSQQGSILFVPSA